MLIFAKGVHTVLEACLTPKVEKVAVAFFMTKTTNVLSRDISSSKGKAVRLIKFGERLEWHSDGDAPAKRRTR